MFALLAVVEEGGGTGAIAKLPEAVAAGLTTAATVATAFRRLFAARIRLGMLVKDSHILMSPAIPFSFIRSSRVIGASLVFAGPADRGPIQQNHLRRAGFECSHRCAAALGCAPRLHARLMGSRH